MYDKELVLEVLNQIRTASQTVLDRFLPVETVSAFTDSPAGREKLDSICMLLIAIGESLKKVDKITIPCCWQIIHKSIGKKQLDCETLYRISISM